MNCWLLVAVLWQYCGRAAGHPGAPESGPDSCIYQRAQLIPPLGNLAARCFSYERLLSSFLPSFLPSFAPPPFPSFVLPLFLAQSLGCHGLILQLVSTQSVSRTVGVINLRGVERLNLNDLSFSPYWETLLSVFLATTPLQ
jgi:hypothetical protein